MRKYRKKNKITLVIIALFCSVSLLFSQTLMKTDLRSSTVAGSREGYGVLPETDPYLGVVTVKNGLPGNMVDWVLVELRSASEGEAVAQAVGCLLSDGSVTDTTGTRGLTFNGLESGNEYYIVVKHRNHLAIMSKNAVGIDEGNDVIEHDFSLSGAAYGGNALAVKKMGSIYAMIAGDGDANGQIQTTDKNSTWIEQTGLIGYYSADYDLNGFVQTDDLKKEIYEDNVGKASQVPNQ